MLISWHGAWAQLVKERPVRTEALQQLSLRADGAQPELVAHKLQGVHLLILR